MYIINISMEKSSIREFICKTCNYITTKKHDYRKHVETIKHLNRVPSIIPSHSFKSPDACVVKESNLKKHECNCGKSYLHHSSLHTHKKKCTYIVQPSKEESFAASIEGIISQNNEFKELIIEQHKQLMQQNQTLIEMANNTVATTNIQNVNVNNTFNLQVFLNIDCKDALSMEDFLKTVVVQLKDLEKAQIAGYSDGVSSIIVGALKALEINKRPIHCSDLKRKTMYIKEGNEWSRENEDNKRMKDLIRCIEHKTIKSIPDWVKAHPFCIKGTHKDSTPYLQMVQQVSGGDLQKGEENINKIINNIAKEVIIVK